MQYNTLIIYKESAIKMIFLILYIEYKDDVKSLFTECEVCGLLKLS